MLLTSVYAAYNSYMSLRARLTLPEILIIIEVHACEVLIITYIIIYVLEIKCRVPAIP
jgi:hypothetical protein